MHGGVVTGCLPGGQVSFSSISNKGQKYEGGEAGPLGYGT